jgi:hypothetical protein
LSLIISLLACRVMFDTLIQIREVDSTADVVIVAVKLLIILKSSLRIATGSRSSK